MSRISSSFLKRSKRRQIRPARKNDEGWQRSTCCQQFAALSAPKEAARRLGISLPTIYRLLRGGELSGVKVGGQWRISDASIQTYLEDGIRIPGN